MNPKTRFRHLIFYLFLLPLVVAISCTNKTDIPFPENGSGYEIPKAVPFQMPEGKPIQWKTYPEDSIPKAVKITFDVEKLPSKPFTINEFKPLKNPITSTSFDWEKLESIPFKADSIDKFPVKVRKFILPNPIVTPASLPSVWTGGTSAIVRLGQAEGLLGNKVYSLLTDDFGSVWIGTERGLHKYNGSEFLTYNFFGKNENGSIEIISDLILDKEGRLVISGLVTGVYRLDITLGIVEHFAYENGFIRMEFDHQGILWGTYDGLFFLDMDKKLISEVDLNRTNSNLNVAIGVKEDSQKNIWIGFGEKIGILDPERKAIRFIGEPEGLVVRTAFNFTEDKSGNVWITAFSTDAFSVSLQNSKIMQLGAAQGYFGWTTDVFEDSMDRLWLISNDTVTVYDPASSKMKKILTGSPIWVAGFPSSSMKGNSDVIWVGTDKDGILLVDPNGMLAENFSIENGLESNDVWGIDEDSQGRIWMATFRGINIYDPAKEKLSLLKLPVELSGNDFRPLIAIGEDKFFAGSMGEGFAFIDVKGKSITHYNTVQKGLANAVFNGLQSPDGRFWIGTSTGLLVFDPSANSFQRLDKSNGLVSNTSISVINDRKGKIWVCSDAGINIIDPKTNTNVTLQKKEGLLSNYNYMVFESESGEVIVGGDEGISIFSLDETSITHVSAKNGLIPPALYDLTEVNGKIHIGSENGIIVVDRPTADNPDQAWHFSNFGKSSGIPYNNYNQSTAFPTKKGPVFWGAAPIMTVVHQDPIIDKNPPVVAIKGMNIMDQNSVFTLTSFLKNSLSEGDTLWNSDFTKGYTKENFPSDSSYLFQNNIQWDSISPGFQMPLNLKLPYDQNSFNFSFVNQSVLGRDKIVYRYVLEGADQAWSDVSPKANSRIYYNLTPGDYTFKVATRGFNGVWSEPATLDFEILPPWWQTWWAYLLFASLFGGLTYGIVHVRSQYLKKENRILEEKVFHRTSQLKKSIDDLKSTQAQLIQSEKMASLGELTAGIAHEIQNPLNFVNNFSEVSNELISEIKEERTKSQEARDETLITEILGDIEQNLEKINHHGKRADAIVKGMLEHSRAGKGEKAPTDINALADEYLRLSYHGLRAKDKSFTADFETDLDPNLPLANVVAQDVGRVILNLINNAFYACAERGRLLTNEPSEDSASSYRPKVSVLTRMVELTGSQGGVEICIKDNGGGIPKAIKDKIFQPFFTTKPTGSGTGLGLSLSYDIVKSHGGDLRVKSTEGEGTEMIIFLPIEK